MPYLRTRIKDLRSDPARYRTVKLFPPPDDRLDTLHGDYRYKLEGQGPRNDPVLRVMVKAILRLRIDDIYLAATDFWIQNLRTDRLWPPTSGSKRVKLYSFKERFEEFPMTLPVRLLRGTEELTVDRIQVKVEGEWKSFVTWIVEHSHSQEPYLTSGERGLNSQRFWWKKNGKFFLLMQLPQELRSLIYQQILGGNLYPDIRYGPDTVVLRPPRNVNLLADCDLEAISRPHSPNYTILRVNKQVRNEALKAVWEGTVKHFIHPYSLKRTSETPTLLGCASNQFNWLTFLQLNFSTEDWFDLLQIWIDPVLHRREAISHATVFQDLSTLKELELFFRSPYFRGYRDPWTSNYYAIQLEYPDSPSVLRYACYKTVVDWIVTFAFPYIKHVPRIRLTGNVKTCLQKKWEYIFQHEYRQRHLSYRTHGYNWEDEVNEIMRFQPVYLTPECSCPASCNRDKKPRDLSEFDKDDSYTPKPPTPPPEVVEVPSQLVVVEPESEKHVSRVAAEGETPLQFWGRMRSSK